jgi:hypothetical protein
MNEFLNSIPSWAFGVCSILVILIIAFLIIKNKLSINFKGVKVNEDDDHLYLIISKSMQLSDEKRDIKIKLRADEQMRFAKAKSADAYALIMRNFRLMLKDGGIQDPMDSREYKIYSQNIRLMLNKALILLYDYFESMNRDSNLNNPKNIEFCLNYIRGEYEIFRTNSINALRQRGVDLITEEWIAIDCMSRDEVHERNECIMIEIGELIGSVFDKSICIQLSYAKRLSEIDNELKEYIEKVKNGEE